MQKRIVLLFFITSFAFAQTEQLAQNYFDKGAFAKALPLYEELFQKNSYNSLFYNQLLNCYQQLQQFEQAENLIENQLKKTKQPQNYVLLGYLYQLQKQPTKADKYYSLAIEGLNENPNYVYAVAQTFEQKVLLEWALRAYETAYQKNNSFNFDYQIALLQGQLGKIDVMIDKLLDFSLAQPAGIQSVKNQFLYYMTTETESQFIPMLKKALLIRVQKNQAIFWNEYLSWLFVQQKEYDKAFVQEKAIFKRTSENLGAIIQLANIASAEGQNQTAEEIFTYILENTTDTFTKIEAHTFILEQKALKTTHYEELITEIDGVLAQFNKSETIEIQLLKAHILAFHLSKTTDALALLNPLLEANIYPPLKAQVKLKMAEIYRFNEKFNQAILLFAQVEDEQKNSELGQKAQFEMAKTSYFKTDFEWALQQVKALKSATSQLIANDALQLFLLINDNIQDDSLKVAITQFAKADFLLLKNKKTEALEGFKQILAQHKGESIEDETLLKIGQIYDNQNNTTEALLYFDKILNEQKESVYTDEALFYTAEIYYKKLNLPEKAKEFYEKIVLNHPDSIFFVEAQQNYRKIRGN